LDICVKGCLRVCTYVCVSMCVCVYVCAPTCLSLTPRPPLPLSQPDLDDVGPSMPSNTHMLISHTSKVKNIVSHAQVSRVSFFKMTSEGGNDLIHGSFQRAGHWAIWAHIDHSKGEPHSPPLRPLLTACILSSPPSSPHCLHPLLSSVLSLLRPLLTACVLS
jgi:hypothetical protein